MRIELTPQQTQQLASLAALAGRDAGEFVHEAFDRLLADESHYVAAVRRGEEALNRGEYVTHETVGMRLSRWLNP